MTLIPILMFLLMLKEDDMKWIEENIPTNVVDAWVI